MSSDPFERAKALWDNIIQSASRHKYAVFGKDAEDAARFYGEAQDFMYTPGYNGDIYQSGSLGPQGYYKNVRHRMSSNLVFNLVEAFLPALYAKDPVRTVTPRRPEVPSKLVGWLKMYDVQEQAQQLMALPGMAQNQMMMQQVQQQVQAATQQAQETPSHDLSSGSPSQAPPPKQDVIAQIRAGLMEWVLNASIKVTDLKHHSRMGLVDGLVKGRGILSTEVLQWGKYTIPISRFRSVDDLLVDPDVNDVRDAKWIAIRRREPVWQTEAEWGWPRGSLKPDHETFTQGASVDLQETATYDRQTSGTTNDLIEYYEVYSRMGVGSFLKGADEELHDYLDQFGQNVRLLISKDMRCPINTPEFLFDDSGDPDTRPSNDEVLEDISARLSWPVPTHERPSGNPWPIAVLDFHRQIGESWPLAHVTPSLPYVKAINWIFSYLMGRVRHASRTFFVTPKNLEDDIKEAILHGGDLELLDIESKSPGTMQRIVDFIQIPNVTSDIWQLLAALKKEFQDSTGVTELMLSGTSEAAFRSAKEASVKEGAMMARPGDMSNTVEDWMADAARNEIFAWLHNSELADVAAIFGEPYQEAREEIGQDGNPEEIPAQMGDYTRLWGQLVMSEDPTELYTYFDFSVESGSSEKKNRQHQLETAQQDMQLMFGPLFQYYARTGDATQINSVLRNWAISREHPSPDELMFPDMRQQMQAQQQMAQEQAAHNMLQKEFHQTGQMPPQVMQSLSQEGQHAGQQQAAAAMGVPEIPNVPIPQM